jgi:hypothetical protein
MRLKNIGSKATFICSLLVIFGLCQSPSYGKDVAGISFPETLKVNDTTLTLNGVGLRTKTFFRVKVYAAGLYLQTPTHDYKEAIYSDQLKKLDLVFLRDVKRAKLIESFKEGFNNNCEPLCKKVTTQFDKLADLISDTKHGDKIQFVFYPGRLYVKQGQRSEDISSRDFTKTILKIFIGDEPPTDELKTGLLGIH